MPSFVQITAQTQSGSILFGAPNAPGNCIVVFIGAFNTGGGGTSPIVSDTQGNSYTQVGVVQLGANSGNWTLAFIAKNIIGGASNTVSYSTSGFGTLKNFMAIEYSGASKTNPVRSEASSYSSGAGTKSVTLTTATSDLVVLYTLEMPAAQTTPPVGFTTRVASGATPPNVANLYDGSPSGSGANPYSVVDTDASGGTLWGVVLTPPTAGRAYAFEM